jgi:hypothetical protein
MQTVLNYLEKRQLKCFYTKPRIKVKLLQDRTKRNEIVYTRSIKIYKNIDNPVELLFVNRDEKPITITGKTVRYYIVDAKTQSVVVTGLADIIDDGSSQSKRGVTVINILRTDIADLTVGLYNFSVKVLDEDEVDSIVYTDQDYNAATTIEILNSVYPDFDGESTDPLLNYEYDFGTLEDNCSL